MEETPRIVMEELPYSTKRPEKIATKKKISKWGHEQTYKSMGHLENSRDSREPLVESDSGKFMRSQKNSETGFTPQSDIKKNLHELLQTL